MVEASAVKGSAKQAQAIARAWKAKAEALEIDAIYLNSELETLRQHVALLSRRR